MQALDPVSDAYLPITHEEHVTVPVDAANVPTAQLVQDAAASFE
jgi:hypothetical protein